MQKSAINQSLLEPNSQPALISQRQAYLDHLPVIDGSSTFQTFLFTWLHPFLKYSNKRGVTVQSMPLLPKNLQTAAEHQEIMKVWQSVPAGSSPGWKLIKTISINYKGEIFKLLLLLFFNVLFYIAPVLLTSYNIDYIQNHREDLQYGIMLFLLTLLVEVGHKLSFSQTMYRFSFFGLKLCNTINMMIYHKSLKYSTLANKRFSDAQIINYSQTDAERMTYAGYQLSSFFYGPIQIVFALFMMYFKVKTSFLSGVAVLLLVIILNYFISKKINKLNDKVFDAKDKRIKGTEEVLSIIRFIKISAIEKFFFGKLEAKRRKQIGLYLKKGLTYGLMVFTFWLTCPLLLSATFLTYVALGNQLTSEVAFTMIMIASVMEYPINCMPTALSELIQISASIKRIQKFLLAEQIDSNLIVREENSNYAIRIQNGNFYWGKQEKPQENKQVQKEKSQSNGSTEVKMVEKDEKNDQGQQKFSKIHALKDINLKIQKGKFVMIIGDIGSGKSSLLQAILNQMIHQQDSKVYISGSIAYSSQKPWIISKTVQENITFNLPYDQNKYKAVIYHSSFEQDLKILPQGNQTQIGEKGINISGGQKARLSLARALYSENDICLLDDILSAVDVHVGDFLMKQTLRGYLKGKTILMPTHALRYIEQADEIIIMKKGKVVKKGSPNEIKRSVQYQQIAQRQTAHDKKQNKDDSEDDIQAQMVMIKEAFQQKSNHLSNEKVNINNIIIQQLILPEDQEKGHVSWKVFKQFVSNSGGYKKFVFPILLSMFCWISCKTLAYIILERGCEDYSSTNSFLLLFVFLLLVSNIFILARSVIMAFSSTKQGKLVHDKMMKSLLYASISNFFNRVPVGRIVSRLTKDLREIDEDIAEAMSWIVFAFFSLLSTLAICLYASSVFAIIPMIVVGVISNQFRKYYMKTQRQLTRYQKSTNSPVLNGFMSTINGLASIRAYKVQKQFMEAQMKITDTNKRVRLSKSGLQNWFSNILSFLCFMVNMPCIAYCMFSNSSNPSLVGLLMVYALALCENMTQISLASANFQNKLVSLQRIYTFMNIQPEQDYKQYCQNWQEQEEGGKQVFQSGSLEFSNLSVNYRTDLPNVLKHLSCKIKAGEKIGIVGRTGAGKSTIVNTLLRITNISSGNILIDGKYITQFQLKNLRYSMTMIDQQPTLIKSTFRENLDLTNRYSDQQLLKILKQCNLLDVINEKGGLDAIVSNTSLSAGEKQLLCICRAFLKQSKIVLIDQATANIDAKNDALIQKVISEKFKNSTVLTIAHRLSTLKNSDKIMVLEKGELIEFGEPGQLQRRDGGFYAEMMKKNSEGLLE